jgi:hypothetical protein
MRYGEGDPNSPEAKVLHAVPIGNLTKRLAEDADDYRHIANYCVVTGDDSPEMMRLQRTGRLMSVPSPTCSGMLSVESGRD